MKFLTVLLVGVFSVCYAAPAGECATYNAITLPLTNVGEKYYYVETGVQANWHAAMTFCHLHKMHLASIITEAENNYLAHHIRELGLGANRLWTSGSDLAGESNWFWTGVGTRMVYKKWDANQPDNLGEEDCLDVRMVDNVLVWNDNNCAAELNFICEA